MTKRPKGNTLKLRPPKTRGKGTKHGVWALDKLLKANLDGRLHIAKKRDRLEADLIGHCGGPDALSPPMICLIKRIVHKELISQHAEKMALLGEYSLGDKQYIALSNSLRLDICALEGLLRNGRTKGKAPSIQEIIEAESKGE